MEHPLGLKEVAIEEQQNNVGLSEEDQNNQETKLIDLQFAFLVHEISSIIPCEINIFSEL